MFCIFLCFLLSSWLWRLVNTGDTDLILQRFSCQYLGLKMFQMLRDRIYLDKNTEHQKRFLNPLLVGAFNVWFKAPVLLLSLFACHLILSKNMRGSIFIMIKIETIFDKCKTWPSKECLVCTGNFRDKCDPFWGPEITVSALRDPAITSVLWETEFWDTEITAWQITGGISRKLKIKAGLYKY